jgi:hypothetical protein
MRGQGDVFFSFVASAAFFRGSSALADLALFLFIVQDELGP